MDLNYLKTSQDALKQLTLKGLTQCAMQILIFLRTSLGHCNNKTFQRLTHFLAKIR